MSNYINDSEWVSNMVGTIIAVLTLFLSFIIFRSQSASTIRRERHDKLICPLFFLLEPVLYKEPDKETMEQVYAVIDANPNLVDGKLHALEYYCKSSLTRESFIKLCSYVNFQYDLSCHRLHLRTRGITYRLTREQYKTKTMFLLYIAFFSILLGVAAILFFAYCYRLISRLDAFTSGGSEDLKSLILFALPFFAMVLLTLRYTFNHK
jgi:hypothetical protein